jgi:hypothetical protein
MVALAVGRPRSGRGPDFVRGCCRAFGVARWTECGASVVEEIDSCAAVSHPVAALSDRSHRATSRSYLNLSFCGQRKFRLLHRGRLRAARAITPGWSVPGCRRNERSRVRDRRRRGPQPTREIAGRPGPSVLRRSPRWRDWRVSPTSSRLVRRRLVRRMREQPRTQATRRWLTRHLCRVRAERPLCEARRALGTEPRYALRSDDREPSRPSSVGRHSS